MTSARQYPATACGPGCGDGLDYGTLWFNSEGVSFRGNGGAFTLPAEGLKVERGGATGDTVRFTNPAYPEWFISTTDLAVQDDPAISGRADVRAGRRGSRKRMYCCGCSCLTVLLLAALLVWGLFASRDTLVGFVADRFPQEWEHQLGNHLAAAMVPEESRITEPDLLAGLHVLADPIFQAIPRSEGFTSFSLHLSPDPTPNAFAIPGGHIVVNAGLILEAGRPEEVAGVIAHEAAHATLRHGLRSLISRLGTMAAISLLWGDIEGVLGTMVVGSEYLLNQKYSRDFERQADEKAWEYLLAANIDPTGLTGFFERLKAMERATGSTPALLSTHPATSERIAALEKHEGALQPDRKWREFSLDFAAYQSTLRARIGP